MPQLTRRQALRLALLSGAGGVLAACAGSPAAQPPTAIPAATSAPPTSAPTSAPTAAATQAPAAAAATSAPAAPTAAPTSAPASPAPAIAQAAQRFLDALDGERRARASYAFGDAERVRWHWTTPQSFPRNGLPLAEMDEPQRAAALALLEASSSLEGYRKAGDIMALQAILGNDPLAYYVTVFGNPGGAEPWGWRWEGHHLSRHVTVAGETLTMTPFFLGAWPTTTDAGARAMAREEDAARELVTSLDGALRDQAIFQTRTLTRHETQNQPAVAPLEPVGVALRDLGAPQQALAAEILRTYVAHLPQPVADPLWARLEAAGVAEVRFGWAGALEPGRPHYYRLQGPTFLLEFDNSRNGGTHIHSVWRDFAEDFGAQGA